MTRGNDGGEEIQPMQDILYVQVILPHVQTVPA